ncbi:MAG: UDP-N-acetylmuramoyl-tripeptide--D-alanyl-D-alanine ligase [bacterium]|nr:UDP-N-acetylmuramoyl-tripeptide--D-alanyl-D-alanine ligase [bacterium]
MLKKSILQQILVKLARATIRRYKPVIIGVTGSVGKTSTREAIACILAKKYRIRQPEKNFNNEIGLPLTILGISHCGQNIFKWVWWLKIAFGRIYLWRVKYPEVLILEYGIDRPGDMDILLGIAKPKIAVVTAIGKTPVHIEFFASPAAVAEEKEKLITALPADGTAILNADDEVVRAMCQKTKARILTFGKNPESDVRAEEYSIDLIRKGERKGVPKGMSFQLVYDGILTTVRLDSIFGEPQMYAIAAAVAVGGVMDINLHESVAALHEYKPPTGRMRLLEGIHDTLILDDTYNAAPEAMRAALTTLTGLPAKRRIAILGDMLELGEYAEEAHRAIGRLVRESTDVLIAIGSHSKIIAEEVHVIGKQVYIFSDAISAAEEIVSHIQPGDLILVKGSQGMRMERIVKKIMAHPEDASKYLVRQDAYWK